jgi:hypothetical protein
MDTEKEINELKSRLEAAEKTIKALITAIKSIEDETGDDHMPQGEYYGHSFN